MQKKERDKIVAELKAEGHITTDERLLIIKMKIEDDKTPPKERFRCLDLIRVVLNKDARMDIQEWFKELVALTDDVIRSQQYVKR